MRFVFPSFNSVFHRVGFKLIKFNFSVFVFFIDHDFRVVSKSLFANLRSTKFSTMFSSRILIILHFTFRFMIHLEVIFVRFVNSLSRLTSFLHFVVQFFQPFVE